MWDPTDCAVSVFGVRGVDAVGAQCESCYDEPVVWCELLSPGGISFHITRL